MRRRHGWWIGLAFAVVVSAAFLIGELLPDGDSAADAEGRGASGEATGTNASGSGSGTTGEDDATEDPGVTSAGRSGGADDRVWVDAGADRERFRVARDEAEARRRLEHALQQAVHRRAAAGEEPTGRLEPEYIQERVRELRPLLAECYELALTEQPDLEGRLVVEFTIIGEPDVGGIVEESHVDEEESDLHHPLLSECVRETMYTAEFEAPEGGGSVRVRYPFVMRQGDPEEGANE